MMSVEMENMDICAQEEVVMTSSPQRTKQIKPDDPQKPHKAFWLEGECKLLISLYKELQPELGKTFECGTKKKMWEIISVKMREQGCNYSGRQILDKWRLMEKHYKNKLLYNKKTSLDNTSMNYESELSEIFLDRPAIKPESFPSGGKGKMDEQILDCDLLFEEDYNVSAEPETHIEVVFPDIEDDEKFENDNTVQNVRKKNIVAEKKNLFRKEKEKFVKRKEIRILRKNLHRKKEKEEYLEEYKKHVNSEQKTKWLDKDCKLLISLYKYFRPQLGKTLECGNKNRMWELVSIKMREQGCNYTARQIQDKWRLMGKHFQKKMSHNKKTGYDNTSMKYERELSEIFLDRPAIVPEFFPGSSGKGRVHEQILDEGCLLIEEDYHVSAEPEAHIEVVFPDIIEDHEKFENTSDNTVQNVTKKNTVTEKIALFMKEKETSVKRKERRILSKDPESKQEKVVYINEYKKHESSEQKAIWLDKDCKLLISLYKYFKPQLGKTFKHGNKKKMWELITIKMREQGCNFSVRQVQDKWRLIEKHFQNKVLYNKITGHDSTPIKYEKELSEIFLERPAILPEIFPGSSKGRRQVQIFDDSGLLFEQHYHPSAQLETPIESPFQEIAGEECENTFKSTVQNVRKKNTVAEEIGLFRELIECRKKHLQSEEAQRKKEKAECLEAYKERTEAIKKLTEILTENLKKS